MGEWIISTPIVTTINTRLMNKLNIKYHPDHLSFSKVSKRLAKVIGNSLFTYSTFWAFNEGVTTRKARRE